MKSKLYIIIVIVIFLLSPLYIALDAKVVESVTKTQNNKEFITSGTLSEMETVVAKNATTEESSAVDKEYLTPELTLGDLGLHKENMLYLGKYKITFYTASADENGGYVDVMGNAITVTGNPVQANFTAAVQDGSIPYGTVIYISEHGTFIVDDCGVGENQIDIAVDSKEQAQSLGVQYLDVYALKGE